MGIIEEVIYLIRQILGLVKRDWTKLKYDEVPGWLLRKARRDYWRRRKPIGNRAHFIGRTFFYKVWYEGKRNWIFYRKKK